MAGCTSCRETALIITFWTKDITTTTTKEQKYCPRMDVPK